MRAIKIIGLIVAIAILGFFAFVIYLNFFKPQTLDTPPSCPEGYGYTIMLGSSDAPVYSKCRKGPNIDKYPHVNF